MSDTPRTDAAWENKELNILVFARCLERELSAMTKERDKWANLAAQYSQEREHNANMALAYKAERDKLLSQVNQPARDETLTRLLKSKRRELTE